MSIPDELERRLTQALASTATVISFEKRYLEGVSLHYSQDIVSFCERLERDLQHWMASEVTEANVAEMLILDPPQGKSRSHISLYRAICRALQERQSGIVCIYDIEDLPSEAFQLLSRLLRFVRENNLRWQFLLIGEISKLAPISTGMLHIDISYPEVDWPGKQRLSGRKSSAARAREGQGENEIGQPESTVQDNQIGTLEYSAIARNPSWPAWALASMLTLIVLLVIFNAKDQLAELVGYSKTEAKKIAQNSRLVVAHNDSGPLMSNKLEQAYRLADLSEVDRLVDQGESINAVSGLGETGLIMAAQASDRNLIKALLKRNVDPNLLDEHGHSALFYACVEGKADIVKRLLEAGTDANSVDQFQKTALTIAARAGSVTIVKLLLRHGANSDWQDAQGWTPLFYAAWNDDATVARALLNAAASSLVKDKDGYTAADIARIRRSKKVAGLLN